MNDTELELFMKKVNNRPLPKGWNKFVKDIAIKHNVIYKNRNICKCTNCNNTFNAGKIKVGDIAVCPHCNNQYSVMGTYLYYRGQSFEKSVVVCQRINKQIVIRVIEIYTYFDRIKSIMITSTQEYARIIVGVGTFLNNATFFYMGHQHIYHNEKNIYWRKYDGVRDYAIYTAYPYNKSKLIKNTLMEYAPIKEFLRENPNYNYLQAVCLAAYPSFELMYKAGLKNLSKYSYLFNKTGSFQNIFGVPKSFLEFMVKNDIDYRDLQVLRLVKKADKQILDKYRCANLNSLKTFKKYTSISKHVDICSELSCVLKKDLDYVLGFVKLNKLVKYKQIANRFSIYKDYLTFIEKLGFDMTNTQYLFPTDLIEAHDKFEKELKVKQNIEISTKIYERFLDLSNYIYEDDKYIIYPAPYFEAFEEESRMQKNCVRQYATDYADKETEIYFMRNKNNIKKSLVTVEYDNGQIVQQQQKHHNPTTNEQKDFLKNWLELRNKKKNVIIPKADRTLFVA